MEDVQSTTEALRELKGFGVQLAVDGFGMGCSSLAYLKRFPVDYSKIERSFVDALEEAVDTTIVPQVIMLVNTLRMQAVAEGVETADQLEESAP